MIQISNLEEITEADIQDLVDKIQPELDSRKTLWERVHRKANLSDLAFDVNGNSTNITFEKYISLMSAGFLGGKAPVYTVNETMDEKKRSLIEELLDKKIEDENYKDKMSIIIDYITNYNDDSTEHYNLIRDALELRGAYELVYENENNEIIYSKLDPLQTVAIWDYNIPRNLIGLVNIHEETNVNGTTRTIVEITDKNGTRKFSKDNEVFKGDKVTGKAQYTELATEYENHNWNDVPAFAVELDESIFESVVDVILKYQKLVENTSNMFQYNDEMAKFALYGYAPENEAIITEEQEIDGKIERVEVPNPAREAEDRRVLDSKTLYFPDKSSSGGEWILKDIPDTATQNTLKTYIDLILMMAGVPNTFDLGFTNADNASALDRKFFSLSMIVIDMIQQFKMGYKRRWELIFNRINLKKNTNFDFRDIMVDLPCNVPANESEVIDMWLKLRGLASDETITERLPLGLDYISEQAKITKQNEEHVQATMELNKQYEVGEANVGGTRSTTQKAKTNLPEAEQENTNEAPGDIQ